MSLAPQIPFLTAPAAIVNQALDGLGQSSKIVGDLTDGSVISEAARRHYGIALRALLRTAHWNFARKQAQLQLLGDATGQSASPVITYVDQPWTYAYAWPIDGVALRWMPLTDPNNSSTGIPLTTAPSYSPMAPSMPTRFLVSSTEQYPTMVGNTAWSAMPDYQRIEGAGPTARRVILCDNPNAQMIYTRLVTSIEEWDPMFRTAMVASMQVILAPVAIDNVRERESAHDKALARIKNIIDDARVANGNDAGFPQSVDHVPSWISARNGGLLAQSNAWGAADGYFMPWEPWSLGGSVF